MSVSELAIYYPSPISAYYATGQWIEKQTGSPGIKYGCRFALANAGELKEELIFNGVTEQTADYCGTFFRADPSKGPDPLSNPSSITKYYWLQAKIPQCVHARFLNITNNSGKFLVFVSPLKIDSVWDNFKTAYEKGKLGYGLQCSTLKYNPHSRGRLEKVITIHIEDSFDLDQVAQTAWEIDRVLDKWEGLLQYMTDRTTKSFYGTGAQNENQMLYSISSRSFVDGAINGGTNKKTLPHFTTTFKMCFTGKAQQRQETLQNKNWKKFLGI